MTAQMIGKTVQGRLDTGFIIHRPPPPRRQGLQKGVAEGIGGK